MGSRPEASGSSVPVWPAFSARSSRLAFCRASLLDKPTGLSSNNTPCRARLGCGGGRVAVMGAARSFVIGSLIQGPGGIGFVDQRRQVGRTLGGAVELEVQRRHGVDLQTL